MPPMDVTTSGAPPVNGVIVPVPIGPEADGADPDGAGVSEAGAVG